MGGGPRANCQTQALAFPAVGAGGRGSFPFLERIDFKVSLETDWAPTVFGCNVINPRR